MQRKSNARRTLPIAALALLALALGLSLVRLDNPHVAVAAATLSDDDKQTILKQHNDVRAKYNIAPLVWDDTLAALALDWANQLAAGTVTGHRPDSKDNKYGENIWQASPPDSAPVTDAATSWVGEVQDYNLVANTCADGKACGHFTQVVWAGTMKVGCAKASGNNWDYIVCNYDPAGNIDGVPPFAVPPQQ